MITFTKHRRSKVGYRGGAVPHHVAAGRTAPGDQLVNWLIYTVFEIQKLVAGACYP